MDQANIKTTIAEIEALEMRDVLKSNISFIGGQCSVRNA
jgi:hypothetical protein